MMFKMAMKLILGFGITSVLALAPMVYELLKFDEALRLVTGIARYDTDVADMLKDIAVLQSDLRSRRETAIAEASLASAGRRPFDARPFHRQYTDEAQQIRAAVERLQAVALGRTDTGVSPERRQLWRELLVRAQDLERALGLIQVEATTFFESLEQGRLNEALGRRPRLDELRQDIEAGINHGSNLVQQLTVAGANNIQDIHDNVNRSVWGASALVLVTAALVALIISRSFTRRLAMAIRMVSLVGDGDLSQRAAIGGRDELAILGRHLDDMADRLRAIAGGTRLAAENVHAATEQIRASAQAQSASAAEQLAAVEETLATLNQITESGAQISQRSQEVARNGLAAAGASALGQRAVEDTLQAMDGIREQAEAVAETIVMLSERTQIIGEIIVTVNDIAERSHLLALNAAIEAAAAGEHGRSFAVVAAEIKTLADQAKDATAQVRSNLSAIQHGINSSVMLTEEAVKRVGAGRRQAEVAQATIRDLAQSVQESVQAFQQIVAGTGQQQIGMEQIVQALQSIRQAVSLATSGTRQLERAAADLGVLGEGLVDAVRIYRL
jgi:methyl-accepting chemotaxis protein